MITAILLIALMLFFFGVLTFCAVTAIDYARHFKEYTAPDEDEDDET